jgi:hypothetical protein
MQLSTEPSPIIYIVILVIAALAALAAVYFLFISKNKLTRSQDITAKIMLWFSVSVALFIGGLWIGDRLHPSIVVQPASEVDTPFLKLTSFSFDNGAEGWETDPQCAPTTLSNGQNSPASYEGTGFLKLATELKGRGEGEAITLPQMACLRFTATLDSLALTDGIVAFAKIPASLDALANQFYAEFQVRGQSGQDTYWSKSRYTLKVGEWVPIVWTKPSWLQKGDQEIFFPSQPDGIWIMFWADKGYKGDIDVDGISLYMIQRR